MLDKLHVLLWVSFNVFVFEYTPLDPYENGMLYWLPILVPLIRRLSSVAVDYVPSSAFTWFLSLSSLNAFFINFFDEFFLIMITF